MIDRAIGIFVLYVLMAWQPATAKENLHIYTERFVPYNFIHDKQITGINVELVKRSCVEAELRCTFELLSWPRAFKFAQQNPQAGLVSVSRTPKRETLFNWVGPLVYGEACLYKLKRRTEIPLLNKALLNNYTIGLMRNDVYQAMFSRWGLQENAHYLVYSERYEDVRAFVLGKLDLILASSYTLAHYLQSAGIGIEAVEPVYHIQDPSLKGNFLAMNLAVSPQVLASLQRALENIPQAYIDSLIEKYVPGSHTRSQRKGAVRACF